MFLHWGKEKRDGNTNSQQSTPVHTKQNIQQTDTTNNKHKQKGNNSQTHSVSQHPPCT